MKKVKHNRSKSFLKSLIAYFSSTKIRCLSIFCVSILPLCFNANNKPGMLFSSESRANGHTVTFTENKGQVTDQNHNPRPDVLFSGSARGMVYHLRNNGISYQLYQVKSDQNKIYRMDINWLNVNNKCEMQLDEAFSGYDNFYQVSVPVLNVKSYKGVTYKNIYKQIDLHYYEKSGDLKYDFIVAPNADYKQIKFKVDGAEKIALQTNGSLIFKTPLGDVMEGAPIVYQMNKRIAASWVLRGNTLEFEIPDYNPSLPLLIDPLTRVWGTYYGGQGTFGITLSSSTRTDLNGNVYMAGNTDCNTGATIATAGAHQTILSSGLDAYLVKFNSAGARQWSTYYGGINFESEAACSVDAGGNVYFSGRTDSPSNIATPGSHQAAIGGGVDGFLVKFNSNGVRQWGTYYGGLSNDGINQNTVDNNGDILLVGSAKSTSGISTVGSHQVSYAGTTDNDAFLVKFNSNGVRLWGTYYGGTSEDLGSGICVDATNNVFISGSSISTSGIASPGAHQSTFGGGTNDAFIAKFNSNGVRQWGTYYGDTGTDLGARCCVDNNGNSYLCGDASSTSGIATIGSYQSNFGGGTSDGFIVKFNSNGVRQWGTYFGGSDIDAADACANDALGNVLVTGLTKSTANIATVGSYQSVFGGGGIEDAFFAKFSSTGLVQWATYYGGGFRDSGSDVAIDANGRVYLSGSTATWVGTVIATQGGHQPTFLGANNGFLVQFTDCNLPNPPVNTTPPNNLTLCSGNTTTVSATATGTISWYISQSSTVVLATGGSFATPSLSPGIQTFYAETSNTCSPSGRTAITITVNPQIAVNSGTICNGNSFTIIPTGVISHTFLNGSAVVSPTITSSYTVIGTDQGGCTGAAVSSITVSPLPNVTVNSGSICAGSFFTIQPSGAASYSISGIASIVNPAVNTSYTVTGASLDGCIGSAISNVSVNPSPTVNVVSSKTISCKGEPVKLTANGAVSYSWNNGSSNGSITVSPTITTSYTVTGVGANTCSKKTVFTQSVNACTGLNSLASGTESFDFHIFPNPNNGTFHVTTTLESENVRIQVYNSLGQLIINEGMHSGVNKINLTQSANGIYFVRFMESNSLLHTEKIIKY